MSATKTTRRTLSASLSPAGFVLRLLLGLWPLLHLASVFTLLAMPWAGVSARIAAALAVLLLLPPLLARLVLLVCAFSREPIAIGSKPFFAWWALVNVQMIFCRWPFLEETIRLVPGLYSAWLRLWGSRIGRMTYWSPGVMILDRSFLDIGNEVVFGAGVRLNPHVISHDENGRPRLLLAPVKIGDRVLVGGYSLLTAGTEVASDQELRAHLLSPPFTVWKAGRRDKEATTKATD